MALRIGIDIGSTTVKVVVLDAQNKLLFRSYERHYSKTRERTCETLRGLRGLLGGQQVQLLITGSAGLGVAKAAGLDFVQEVYATAAAVREFIPGTDAVIELGGEDAKIIFFGNTLEERMNGSCAGGTGAFIDQMATLLNVSVDELDELSLRHEKIYPIASRCGVFAKSDIQPILNQGGRKEDVAASIFQAVVDQTVAGLTQGRELKGTIVFLGGPLHFLAGLRQRFVETLHLDQDHAIFPEDGDCFAAIGAALCTEDSQPRPFEELLDLLEHAATVSTPVDTMDPLFTSQADYEAFSARHQAMAVPTVDLATYTGPAYLGIDAGSTTTKMVLIDPDCNLLYSFYHSNQGNPVSIVLPQLREIYAQCGDRVTIQGAAVTGYGEDLIKNAFSCDLGLVETVAHLNAARHFTPDVDFIIDIGDVYKRQAEGRPGSAVPTLRPLLPRFLLRLFLGLFLCLPALIIQEHGLILHHHHVVLKGRSLTLRQRGGIHLLLLGRDILLGLHQGSLGRFLVHQAEELLHLVLGGRLGTAVGFFLRHTVFSPFYRSSGAGVMSLPLPQWPRTGFPRSPSGHRTPRCTPPPAGAAPGAFGSRRPQPPFGH